MMRMNKKQHFYFSILVTLLLSCCGTVSAWTPLSTAYRKATGATSQLQARSELDDDDSRTSSLNTKHPVSSRRKVLQDAMFKVVPLVCISSSSWMVNPTSARADDDATTTAATDATTTAATEVTAVTDTTPSTESSNTNDEPDDFIARLKKQSDANKDVYRKQSQMPDKLSVRQFQSQYKRPKYIGVRHDDDGSGRIEMVKPDELDAFLKSGKVEQKYDMIINDRTGQEGPDYKKGKIYVFTK